ncbi:MAG: hypothetical protein KKA64_01225 [Nanoarchaeota archaeon]|nr:hypothetical protein [Nanoarchaeota archaeon]
MIKNLEKKAKAYALKNALAYNGKAVAGAVISSLFHEGLKKEEVKNVIKDINKIVKEVNSLSLEEQEKEFINLEKEVSEREEREGLPELPNAEKGVVMRFRPAPSGPMHIGHIISNLSSSLYVKKYGGKFYVIIDDTDPTTSKKEYYDQIKKDCDWIFGNVYKYIIVSDRIEIYYKYSEELIKKGYAYVCTCTSEKFKKLADDKKECPCRTYGIKDNLERWKKMLDKTSKGYKPGEAVLRFKSDINNPNPAMRDFPLARINTKSHPFQKKKYKVWPLMNLAVSVDDMELKMTHIIRGKDHRDNAERQKMIYNVLKKIYPWNAFIGRIKFTDLVLSKRKINAMIESGEFSGVEDEKLPTVSSLRKRGYNPEAFVKLIAQRGISEVDKVISSKDFFKILDNFNQN